MNDKQYAKLVKEKSQLAAFRWHWSAPVVFCLCSMDELIKLPAVFLHYRKYIWLRNITRDNT